MMRREAGATTLERSTETQTTGRGIPRLRNARRRRVEKLAESSPQSSSDLLEHSGVSDSVELPERTTFRPDLGKVASATRDTRAVRGVDLGPWDVCEVEDERSAGLPESVTGFTNPDGSKRLSLVCCDIDIPVGYTHWVGLDSVIDGTPDSIHFRRSARQPGLRGTTISVRVLAAPKSGDRWNSICQEVYDLTRAMAEKTESGAVRRQEGLYGSEVHVFNGSSRQQTVVGVDGPRWTAIATIYGTQVSAADLRATYLMLSTMVVYRSFEPKMPDEPLSVQIVRPEG